jgi:hypothetical protein
MSIATVAMKSGVGLRVTKDHVFIIHEHTISEYGSSTSVIPLKHSIIDCAMNSMFMIVLTSDSVISIFAFSEIHYRYLFVVTFEQHTNLTSVAILADTISSGTNDGEFIVFHIVPGFRQGDWELDRADILVLGQPVCHLSSSENCVVGSTTDGEILRILLIETNAELEALMDIFSRNIRSSGDLNKSVEQSTRQTCYIVANRKIGDLQVAFLFLSQQESEQRNVLEGSAFSPERASQLLMDSIESTQ